MTFVVVEGDGQHLNLLIGKYQYIIHIVYIVDIIKIVNNSLRWESGHFIEHA